MNATNIIANAAKKYGDVFLIRSNVPIIAKAPNKN